MVKRRLIMNILAKKLDEITFDEVTDFCKEGYSEGYQLDYKKDLSKNLLEKIPKHVAALSNSRGGLIIFGVEEDKKTGKPTIWEGIDHDATLEDKLNQIVCNVSPLPSFDTSFTNEVNGKAFLLLRILEGPYTPYYPPNDPTEWVRTGKIRSAIDPATPEYKKMLFDKRKTAKIERELTKKLSDDIFEACMIRSEGERRQLVEQSRGSTEPSRIYPEKLGSQASIMSIHLQPYFPSQSMISPQEIKDIVNDLYVEVNRLRFPNINCLRFETVPKGISGFYWSQISGAFTNDQIMSNGFIRHIEDVLDYRDGIPNVHMMYPVRGLLTMIRSAAKIYERIDYTGSMIGEISLDNMQDCIIHRVIPEGWSQFDGTAKKGLLKQYSWDIELDTIIANDPVKLKDYFKVKVREIFAWLGFELKNEDSLEKICTDLGLQPNKSNKK